MAKFIKLNVAAKILKDFSINYGIIKCLVHRRFIMPTSESIQFNEQFLEWLLSTPESLKKFLDVAKEWYDLQGDSPTPVRDDAGPDQFEIGGHVDLKTKGLSHADIDALTKNYAEAIVKEKAIEYIKGFITGAMMFAGA